MSETALPEPAKVFFTDLRARSASKNRTAKIKKLFEAAGFDQIVNRGDLTAIKVHFGERGCDTHISPTYVRTVVERIKARGGLPFVTDTNTLYSGSRHNAVDHLLTAVEHGFDYAVLGARSSSPTGLDSTNVIEVPLGRQALSARSRSPATSFGPAACSCCPTSRATNWPASAER